MSARQLTIGKLNAAKQATIKKGTGKIAAFKHYIEKVKLFSFAFSKSTTGEPTFLQGDNSERFCRNDASLEVDSGQIGFFLHCLAQDVFHILCKISRSGRSGPRICSIKDILSIINRKPTALVNKTAAI